MQNNSKVHFMPPTPKREKRVGIYCRISTDSDLMIAVLEALAQAE